MDRREFAKTIALGLSGLLMGSLLNSSEGIFRNKGEFHSILGIPNTLSEFLEDKKATVKLGKNNDFVSKSKDGKSIMYFSGFYSNEDNEIEIPEENHKSMYHEIGHALWDTNGNDDIFSSDSYLGPSKENFRKVLENTEEFKRQKKRVLKEYAHTVYCFFTENKSKEESEKITKIFEETEKLSSDDKSEAFLNNMKDYGDINTVWINNRSVNETFAVLFSEWMKGKKTQLNNMFERMKYKGKNLKS